MRSVHDAGNISVVITHGAMTLSLIDEVSFFSAPFDCDAYTRRSGRCSLSLHREINESRAAYQLLQAEEWQHLRAQSFLIHRLRARVASSAHQHCTEERSLHQCCSAV